MLPLQAQVSRHWVVLTGLLGISVPHGESSRLLSTNIMVHYSKTFQERQKRTCTRAVTLYMQKCDNCSRKCRSWYRACCPYDKKMSHARSPEHKYLYFYLAIWQEHHMVTRMVSRVYMFISTLRVKVHYMCTCLQFAIVIEVVLCKLWCWTCIMF